MHGSFDMIEILMWVKVKQMSLQLDILNLINVRVTVMYKILVVVLAKIKLHYFKRTPKESGVFLQIS